MSRSWVISEILMPCAPRAPMKRFDTTNATPAGRRVTIGASTERKIRINSKMIKRNENNWTRLPVRFELAWFATLVATVPARWKWRSGGAPSLPKVACRRSRTGFWSVTSTWLTPIRTRMRATLPSGDVPSRWVAFTFGTAAVSCASWTTAAASALTSVPFELEATTKTSLVLLELPRIGVASVAAFALGALEGRNWLLSLFTSLPREGSARDETTMTTIQARTTGHLKRTTRRPRLA